MERQIYFTFWSWYCMFGLISDILLDWPGWLEAYFVCGRFKWSNMMDDDEKTATNDIDEDMVSMMFAAGLWHMEHAHWVKFFIFIFIFFLSKRQLLWFVSKLWLVSNFCKYTMYAMAQEARTPLYKPCSMCSPKGYGLWAFLVWKQVHTFCLFWSGMG